MSPRLTLEVAKLHVIQTIMYKACGMVELCQITKDRSNIVQ